MKKKFLIMIGFIIYILFMYLFQLFIIDNKDIFGVKPNLILVTCVMITLYKGIYKGTFVSLTIGLFTDFLFGTKAIFMICYTLTCLIIGLLGKGDKNIDKLSVIYFTFASTSLFEILEYIVYAVTSRVFSNFFYLLKQIILGSILNVVAALILYKVVCEISDFIIRGQKKDMNGF